MLESQAACIPTGGYFITTKLFSNIKSYTCSQRGALTGLSHLLKRAFYPPKLNHHLTLYPITSFNSLFTQFAIVSLSVLVFPTTMLAPWELEPCLYCSAIISQCPEWYLTLRIRLVNVCWMNECATCFVIHSNAFTVLSPLAFPSWNPCSSKYSAAWINHHQDSAYLFSYYYCVDNKIFHFVSFCICKRKYTSAHGERNVMFTL